MTAYVPGLGSRSFPEVIRALTGLAAGRSNATGTVTLTPSATSTVVNDPNFAPGANVHLTPMTADAAAALGGIYFTLSNTGSFTINHASNAQTDRQFTYAIIG